MRYAPPNEPNATGCSAVGHAWPLADDLFERFRQAVEARAGHRFHGLRVEVVGRAGVVLYGHTDCYYAKQLAQSVIGRVTGATVLANRIEVHTLLPRF